MNAVGRALPFAARKEQSDRKLLMLLYAETHYPRFGPSRIRRAEPEIVADLPWRVEPRAPLPVLLVVKDAHWYPVELETLTLLIRTHEGEEIATVERVIRERVARPWWWHLETLPPLPQPGHYEVTPVIRYAIGGKRRTAIADNYRGTTHLPFSLWVGREEWPVPPGWLAGDAHTHTHYTRDQVEFGPPIAAISAMSRSTGIGWVALTDHSYDLDDSEHDYLVNDPSLPRWRGLLQEAEEDRSGVCLIPGEEVSCGNAQSRNVHLLGLGLSEHIPGKGDSAERPWHTRPDFSIPEVIERIHQQKGLAVAAHPGYCPPLGERIVFRRGTWQWADLIRPGLDGVQLWNGEDDAGFHRGMEQWVHALLSGRAVVALAGNDSHGAFGRSRRVRLPWVSLTDNLRHLFGKVRTVVAAQHRTRQAILDALARGASYLTDGPALTMEVVASERRFPLGSRVREGANAASVHAVSTSDWGAIGRVGVAVGVLGEESERWTWHRPPAQAMRLDWELPLAITRPAYVRAEVLTTGNARALTNPIWINGAG